MFEINFIGKLSDKTFSVNRHNHKLWEFVYCTAGSGRTVMQNPEAEFAFRAGELLVIPPGVTHGDLSEEGFTNLHFTVTKFDLFRAPVLLEDPDGRLLQILEQANEVFHMPPEGAAGLLSALSELIFAYIVSLSRSLPHNPYVENMKRVIVRRGFSPDFTLSEVYSAVPFNEEYARQTFTAETGCTPLRFLTDMRIEYAKKLLSFRALTDYSIKEIAAMSGFSDQLYFSRVFKKATGTPPAAYRE